MWVHPCGRRVSAMASTWAQRTVSFNPPSIYQPTHVEYANLGLEVFCTARRQFTGIN
eukprot:m.284097 g.284097  ORF g.284097 m.284097 type:complete len:57 (+) comp16194_c0_seq1:1559-1729(+)